MEPALLNDLAARARGLVTDERRALLGITGAPGAGKTTLAVALVQRLRADGVAVAHVPMDGFHLADAALVERGILDRKGAIETFDVHGYLALLRRLRTELDHDVLAPDFERTLEQPIAGAISVRPQDRLVVTEGNYLLDERDAWPEVRAALDETWFVEVPDDVRVERLVRRHVEFGKPDPEARAWVAHVDEPNARRIVARRSAADLVVDGALI
ncbi:nucleoside/nucleotide kinase family protein [Aeromicrobium ginsengisoli]|uniref:Nucleoside/nucleotide kinase family protein n=1 Tax=Aeromicrobium ginsengisoli TaxID=363867 RepID=A0A5M4FBU5_9ACTN|nr:nucleoside/nucleotide kinase family protein [Aeromicrobium ginsengisoli]KAA1395864.1 nucleoside/nucleotide kinase family protein [Aeromicrobium ginsengisoli]